jgi:ABC-type transport system involved in multi-copper enzyme maturation permease subunit
VNRALIVRLVREQRVRLPLEVLLIAAWGFLLVAVFATSEVFTQQLEAQAKQFGGLLDLVGLDPLAQWASIGFQHPIFLLGGGLFSVGLGIRAIAGELEAGSLALALSRPLARRSWFASHLLVLVVGCLVIGEAYALGCLLATTVTSPMGSLEASSMLLAGVQGGLLLLALGGIGFVISAFSSERGRALSWSVGVIVVLYTASFLLPLWTPVKEAAKISPFAWFNPAPLLQRGEVAWGDWVVLGVYAAVPLSVAAWQFARRDLAGG